MIVLGISGFESLQETRDRDFEAPVSRSVEELLSFSGNSVPLQFFPLHLIGHDGAAALIVDGRLTAFAAEERFTRIKHGYNLAGRTILPRRSIEYCLHEARIGWRDVDLIAHYCNFSEEAVSRRFQDVSKGLGREHLAVLEREYETAYRTRLARPVILKKLSKIAGFDLPGEKYVQVRHHLAHAAGSFFSSGFDKSLILTLDGYGEEESSVWAIGDNGKIYLKGSERLPNSLGLLYQVITAYLGFRSFGDEYKVMGLSSYGNSKFFSPVFEELVKLLPDGRYSTENLARTDLHSWLQGKLGKPGSGDITQRSADIAAALQSRLENAVMHTLSHLRKHYGLKKLCVSGGVGLNACVNGAILESGLFDEVFFQPASADDGASLGAAMYACSEYFPSDGCHPVRHVFWGPEYASTEIEDCLRHDELVVWTKPGNIEDAAARLLAQGKIVGWFQGRMEMGPRALGARSILADPRHENIRDEVNRKIKQREAFRPFAPSVLKESAGEFFHLSGAQSSPFMLVTFKTYEDRKSLIPAVVHVDGSSRIQTVTMEDNPRYYRLLRCFYKITGIPLILNTSFNQAGEPVVNTPGDAVSCFLRSGLDVLVLGDYLVFSKSGKELQHVEGTGHAHYDSAKS